MILIDDNNKKQHTYPTYGRQFLTYRWYKPILTGLLFIIFYLLFSVILIMGMSVAASQGSLDPDAFRHAMDGLMGGYDGMDMSDAMMTIVNLGNIVLMIPALWLAGVIVRDRPFTSYSSARGGWNHKVFWKVFPFALLCNSLPIIVLEVFVSGNFRNFSMKFTAASLIVLTIVGPLQCIAEEYAFRGLMMQTFGSWFRVPVIAVILQALVFVLVHPYNMTGKIAVLISGLGYGIAAWISRGIEASTALHIANNMTIFYLQGMNLAAISSNVDIQGVIIGVFLVVTYTICLIIISKKGTLFNEIRKDDLAIANEKAEAKLARKQAASAGKHYKA